jgi:hypothetical protein
MKISATVALAVIASINAEVAMAQCFAEGWSLDNNEAKAWVNDACRSNGGMFTGNFAPGQTKSMCPSSRFSGNLKTKFEVQNQNTNQGFDLGDDDCVKRLNSEIDSCKWVASLRTLAGVSDSTGAKAGIGVGVVLGALAVISLLIYLIYRKRGRRWHPGKQKNPPTGYDGAEMHEMQGKDFGHSVTADKSQQPAEMGLQDSIHELQARD